MRVKTIKLLEENRGVNLHDLILDNDFLAMTQSTSDKRKIDKLASLRLKPFL